MSWSPALPAPSLRSIMSGVERIGTKEFWRAVAAEFLATLLFVFLGLGSTLNWYEANPNPVPPPSPGDPPQADHRVLISLCFGLTIATMVQCFGHISGGHINPAVTLAMLVTKKVSIVKGAFYVVAQLVGGIAGSGLLYLITPDKRRGTLGVCTVHPDINQGLGLLVELLLTFQLVFTIFATCDSKRTDLGGSASFAIGVSITIGHLFGIPYTGANMNPARSFGPALVTLSFDQHWVYWIGPILGAIMAGLLYDFLFCPDCCKPSPGQVIPKAQTGTYKEVDKDGPDSMQQVKKKKRTERKDPPPTREVLSTV
ncbi:aquaporin-4 isoform X2 [Phycodurus eques]|uniref:aquaporin-4 isoform X2 n=1 Tax=Phycodurus eques TaxID=693459 RepID=UPI002ACE5B56|nr:aquaporin-4 isoform X2 [Phycodurus eques]